MLLQRTFCWRALSVCEKPTSPARGCSRFPGWPLCDCIGDWKRIRQVERKAGGDHNRSSCPNNPRTGVMQGACLPKFRRRQAARSSLKGRIRPVGAKAKPTGPRGPMLREGLAQGGEPREETSAREVGGKPGCVAPPCRRPLTYPYAFIRRPQLATAPEGGSPRGVNAE